jgi:hypothetical protein
MPARTDRAIRADTMIFITFTPRRDPDNTIVDRHRLEWRMSAPAKRLCAAQHKAGFPGAALGCCTEGQEHNA